MHRLFFCFLMFMPTLCWAQTRLGTTTGSSGLNAQGTAGLGSTTNTGQSVFSGANSNITSPIAGQQFSQFSQNFSASGIGSPLANATGGRALGTGMGGMGMGGMGMGGMGMGGIGMGMGGFGMGGMGMGGMGRNNGQNQQGQNRQQQNTFRPTLKLGFDAPQFSSQARTQQIQTTMARIPQAERFAGAVVQVQGRKAIVTGTMDQSQANLLKRLLLLEPGIYEVEMTQLQGTNGATNNTGSR